MSRAFTFDFEDVIARCDDRASVVTTSVPTESNKRLAWRAANASAFLLDRRSPPAGAELVFAMAQSPTDLADHFAHRDLLKAAGKTAAYIEELWIKNIPLQPDVRRFLLSFDHIFVGCEATCSPLAEYLGRPVTYLPPAVDLDVFAADPWPPIAIDVYAMGRRQPALHDSLQRWVQDDPSRFYLYDTIAGNPALRDHRDHRIRLADLIRRSQYFLANVAKVNRPDETDYQGEVGYRFFEGAAAGAIMLGLDFDKTAFERLFGWEEPHVVVGETDDDILHKIAELDADPERRAGIRQRNAAGSLRAHDPAHRWKVILEALDLQVPDGVHERIGRLAERAERVQPSPGAAS